MSVEDLLVYMSSLSVLVSVLAVWFAFLHRDVTAQRARLIAAQRRDMRSDMMGPRRREAHQSSMTVMRKVVGTLKLLRSAQANKVAHKLTCAGWRHKDAIVRFFFAKRSEEHTSELQSLMRISYAVFCLKKKKTTNKTTNNGIQ